MKGLILVVLVLTVAPAIGLAAESGWEVHVNSNLVNSVWVTQDRVVWGSSGGVVLYDPTSETFAKEAKSVGGLTSNFVNAVAADNEGSIWMGTASGGVSVLDQNGGWKFHNTGNVDLLSDAVLDISVFGNLVAVGTSGGLSIFEGGQFQRFFNGNDWANSGCDSVMAVSLSADRVLIGTQCGTFTMRFDQGTWNEIIPAKSTQRIAYDGSSLFWIVASDSIYTYDGTVLGVIPKALIVPDIIRDIGARGSSVWVATNNGPSKYDFEGKRWPRVKTGLPSDLLDVRRVRVGPDGNPWIGTKNGAGSFDGSSWTVVLSPGPASNYVQDICVEKAGRVWFTTGYRFAGGPVGSNVGILRYEPGTGVWDQLTTPAIPSVKAFACETDPNDGSVWVGWWDPTGGLARYTPSTSAWTSYIDSLDSRVVSSIYIDGGDNVVFGEYLHGIGLRTPDGRFYHFAAGHEDACWSSTCITAVGPGFGGTYMMGSYYVSAEEGCAAEVARFGPGQDLASAVDDVCQVWTTASGWPQGIATYDFLLDTYGVEWLGSGGGLGSYDSRCNSVGERWHRTNISIGSVWDIDLDRYGNRWIASDDGIFVLKGFGLEWADFGDVEFYDSDNSPLEAVPIKAVEFDADGAVWIGTAGGGMYKFEPPRPEVRIRTWIDVFPNPYIAFEDACGKGLQFSGFEPGSRIRIYTIAGDLVKEIDPAAGWDARNGSGEQVASGVYIYAGNAGNGEDFKGRLVIVR